MESAKEHAKKFYRNKIFTVDYLAKLIEADRAAIRAECAERAVAYCKKWAEFPIGNHGLGALRAAIMAEPPKAAP